MRKLLAAVAVAATLAVGGCSSDWSRFESAFSTLTEAKVPQQDMIVAIQAFNAVEITATRYLSLRKCTATNRPVCRDPVATKRIIPAVRSGRVARNNLRQFMKDNPGALGSAGIVDALRQATNTISTIVSTYYSGN